MGRLGMDEDQRALDERHGLIVPIDVQELPKPPTVRSPRRPPRLSLLGSAAVLLSFALTQIYWSQFYKAGYAACSGEGGASPIMFFAGIASSVLALGLGVAGLHKRERLWGIGVASAVLGVLLLLGNGLVLFSAAFGYCT